MLQKELPAHSTVFKHCPLYKLSRTSAVDRKGNALIPLSVYAVNMAAVFLNAGSNSRISLHKQKQTRFRAAQETAVKSLAIFPLGAGFLIDCQCSQSCCLLCIQSACEKGRGMKYKQQLELMKKILQLKYYQEIETGLHLNQKSKRIG